MNRQHFYTEYRTFVAYPSASKKQYNAFKSLEEYQAAPSSKLNLLIKLVKHALLHDDIQAASFDSDGNVQWPLVPDTPNQMMQKVIVYHEFTMMAPLILSVCFNLT